MSARSIIAALMAADRTGGLGAEAHETIRNTIAFLQVREAFGPSECDARQDRLYDSAYAAGLKAGWNFAQEDDEDGLNRAIEQRVIGHRAVIEAARDEDKAREDAQPVWMGVDAAEDAPQEFKDWAVKFNATNPAPDALRVAMEAFDPEDMRIVGDWIEAGEPKASVPSGRVKALWQSARQALAALQAEVKS